MFSLSLTRSNAITTVIIIVIIILINGGCTTLGATTPTIERLNTATRTYTPIYTSTSTLTLVPPTVTSTLTPTLTVTPTETLTPTLTPVPQELGKMPLEFDTNDLSVGAGQFQIQITNVRSTDIIDNGQYKPKTGDQFFILHGNLYNYADQDQVFNDIDFQADFNKTENVTPDTNLMYAVQKSFYPAANYPDRNVVGYRDFVVPAKRAAEIILVYEASVTTDYIKLYFSPAGIQPRSSLGILLFQRPETDDYYLLKESANNIPQFTVNFVPSADGGKVEELIDSQAVTVDNCFNDESRGKDIAYQWSRKAEVKIENEELVHGGGYYVTPTIGGMLELNVRKHYAKTDTSELSISYTDTLSAAAHRKTNWEVQAYKVSLSGTMIVTFGSQTIEVPYTIGDRLRVEVVSKPADPCPAFTPTP